jgi:hypothetical protein
MDFFQVSLQALRQECPEAYQGICGLLAGKDLLVVLDGEPAVRLQFFAHEIALHQVQEPFTADWLRLHTSWQTILDLVDARLSLLEAVYQGQLDFRGEATRLIVLYEAMLLYLRGGLRSPTFPRLLDEVRRTKDKCHVIGRKLS